MSLLEWGLSARELSHARRVLRDDEQVVLVLRPQAEPVGRLRWMTPAFLCLFALVVAHLHWWGSIPYHFLPVFCCVRPGAVLW